MSTVLKVEEVLYITRKRAEACHIGSRHILLTPRPGVYIGCLCGGLPCLTVLLTHIYLEEIRFVVTQIFTNIEDQQTKGYHQQDGSGFDPSHY